MKGTWVKVWHPDSPGTSLYVYRHWWRKKLSVFASIGEVLKSYKYKKPKNAHCINVIEIHRILDGH